MADPASTAESWPCPTLPAGGPLHRSNFNKMAAWPHAVRTIGAKGLHFTISGTPGTTSRRLAARVSGIDDPDES